MWLSTSVTGHDVEAGDSAARCVEKRDESCWRRSDDAHDQTAQHVVLVGIPSYSTITNWRETK